MSVEEFTRRVFESAAARWPEVTDEIRTRLTYEIGVIADMGYMKLF